MTTEERRFIPGKVELRANDDEAKSGVLVGYAAVFNSLSENLGGFREKIDTNAFDDVLADDVRGVFNHDANFLLGRTKSGTMRLSVDNVGLRYEIDLPNTRAAQDIKESVARGDIDGSSFKFAVARDGEIWEDDEEGRTIRTITKFSRLVDVGPVTFPAYPETSAAQRSLDGFKAAKQGCKKVGKLIHDLEIKKHL